MFNCNRGSFGSRNISARQSTMWTYPLGSVTKNPAPPTEWILPLSAIHVLNEVYLGGTAYSKSYWKYSAASSSGVTGSQLASLNATRIEISPLCSFRRWSLILFKISSARFNCAIFPFIVVLNPLSFLITKFPFSSFPFKPHIRAKSVMGLFLTPWIQFAPSSIVVLKNCIFLIRPPILSVPSKIMKSLIPWSLNVFAAAIPEIPPPRINTVVLFCFSATLAFSWVMIPQQVKKAAK